jgi:hypothetical protein
MVYIQKEIGSPVSPNPTIFDGLKFIAKECLERDLLLALTPGWFGLNGVTLLPQFKAMTDSQLQTYGRFFATQLAPYDNLIIIQGGDANPGKDGPVAQIKNIVAHISRGIREVKPDLLHVYHTTEPEQGSGVWSSSSLWFHDDDYLQLHGSQVHVPGRGYEDIYRLALEDYHRPHPKPHLQLEQGYEGQRFAWLVTPYHNRMGALWSVLHGGCAITYGHKKIWNFTQGWKEALDAPGSLQVTYIASFLEQFPWWTLVPDDDHRIVTSGYGTWYNRGRSQEVYDYVTAAGATERNLALAYVPTRRDVTVDMGWFQSAGSMVLVRWYDPTTPGTFVEVPGSPFPSRGQRTLSMPGPHADQECDYVLVMEAITQ